MDSKDQKNGMWQMVVAMALSGTIGLFVLMSGQSPQTVVFFRCLIGATVLLGWLYFQRAWKKPGLTQIGWIVFGGMALISNWLCLFSAFRLSSISVATVIYHMQPFFLVLLVALLQKELPDWSKLPWLVLAFIGVAMTSGFSFGAGVNSTGALLALAAAFFYALATLATRKLAGIPPAQIAGLQLMLGVVALAPLARFSTVLQTPQSWGSLLILGLLHTGIMYNMMYAAFQRLPATMLATLSFIYPLVAILVDRLFFHTTLTTLQILGMLCILVAVVANQRS